jgi:hypothetical protein
MCHVKLSLRGAAPLTAIAEPVLLLIRKATKRPDDYPTDRRGGRGWRQADCTPYARRFSLQSHGSCPDEFASVEGGHTRAVYFAHRSARFAPPVVTGLVAKPGKSPIEMPLNEYDFWRSGLAHGDGTSIAYTAVAGRIYFREK